MRPHRREPIELLRVVAAPRADVVGPVHKAQRAEHPLAIRHAGGVVVIPERLANLGAGDVLADGMRVAVAEDGPAEPRPGGRERAGGDLVRTPRAGVGTAGDDLAAGVAGVAHRITIRRRNISVARTSSPSASSSARTASMA